MRTQSGCLVVFEHDAVRGITHRSDHRTRVQMLRKLDFTAESDLKTVAVDIDGLKRITGLRGRNRQMICLDCQGVFARSGGNGTTVLTAGYDDPVLVPLG